MRIIRYTTIITIFTGLLIPLSDVPPGLAVLLTVAVGAVVGVGVAVGSGVEVGSGVGVGSGLGVTPSG